MATCLIALGSNLGDREATLRKALTALDVLPATRLRQHSRWCRSSPVGIDASRLEFLNGAALLDTELDPPALLEFLQRLETQHGRRREQRWGDRTLDLDILLYDELILDTPALMVPHPRMSFRRFVLEPAAEIAGSLPHPTIGWTIDQLLRHLCEAPDLAAILSPSDADRRELAGMLASRFNVQITDPAMTEELERLWPRKLTTWLHSGRTTGTPRDGGAPLEETPYEADFPKLTILWDKLPAGLPATGANWDAVVRQPGRGPTLLIRTKDIDEVQRDAGGAFQAVWPHLGP